MLTARMCVYTHMCLHAGLGLIRVLTPAPAHGPPRGRRECRMEGGRASTLPPSKWNNGSARSLVQQPLPAPWLLRTFQSSAHKSWGLPHSCCYLSTTAGASAGNRYLASEGSPQSVQLLLGQQEAAPLLSGTGPCLFQLPCESAL